MNTNETNIEELLVAYIEGDLSDERAAQVSARIQEDAVLRSKYQEYRALRRLMEASPEEEPDERLRRNFQQQLAREKASNRPKVVSARRRVNTSWLNVAAAVVLVVIGTLIGRFWVGDNHRDDEMTALQQDLEETKTLLQQVVDGHLSASQRLARIQDSYQLEQADPEVLNALIRTMNTDTNVNVRIAAIKALAGFTGQPVARQALVESLSTQSDPFVQLLLINLLVEINEDDAVPQFRKLIEDGTTDQSVQDEAQRALFRLS